MGQVQSLFSKWYYHGEVKRHEDIKSMLTYQLTTANLKQPDEWNCTVRSSFDSDTNKDDFSWDLFNNYISDNLMDMHVQLGGRVISSIKMSEAWINVYHQGDSQEVHTHCGGDNTAFSCAYFMQYDPEKDGRFMFYDPNQDMHHGHFTKHYPATNTWFPEVKEGDIVIFPSYLHHQVTPQGDNPQARITVSANFTLHSGINL
ncbi:2OG-Fe(II) oxygenase [Synechococcus phage S-WAM1]|jgi:uncharacterized protein (TIGR02466 family)|uniref:JmjC domain-containing protein n=1 Tax=Synechococcus phage S-WAM1 TaxID=1815521 RepID=A0A1D8KSL9_9CAUD|nr:2OG-Fe(II) oxygenase [Synechococcus phage S-WAM1]AOV61524.1 hypothetical protein P090810_051 [Synechococcus phage S-WAM1]